MIGWQRPVLMTEYRKSMVGQALMYMQDRNMVCGEFHIFYDLDLDKNVNDNAYQTSLLQEALDVNHKMVTLGIGWYQNTFSHLFVIILNMIISVWPFSFTGSFPEFPLINDSMFMIILRQRFSELFI